MKIPKKNRKRDGAPVQSYISLDDHAVLMDDGVNVAEAIRDHLSAMASLIRSKSKITPSKP